MKGDRLPPEDHIARYCGGSHISEDGYIAPTAFHLRPGEEYVSVLGNWGRTKLSI